ncbi:MAG: hypothetical protein EOM72_05770 [Opitutae bacterium]|nr:hypothetical protein [Opitutae bacterium]
MSTRWIRAFCVAFSVFLFSFLLSAHAARTQSKPKAPESSPPATVEADSSSWPAAELTFGFQTRDSETEGLGDLLIPVWNPGNVGLLFVNPRTSFTDHDAEEVNFGLGYRQLLPKQKIILGANAYYDYRDTGYSSYDQWGVGFELLSSWVDARVNYYDPDDKRYVVASETQTTVSQSVRYSEDWSDPYAQHHEIAQDYSLTRILTTTTTSKTFEQYEQALGGYDWEIGLRLPLPINAETLEARVFGGAYDFKRDFGDDAQGWKARAELRVMASLFLDAGVYENKDLTGSDWYAGARLSVPLDLAKISQGRNPFAPAKSRLGREPRDFSARLTEMVMRDPQIRLETSKFLENKQLETADTQRQKDTETERFILLGDVQFVNGDVAASGDGSAENPFSTIQQGANTVFGAQNIYVYNASRPYNENVVLQAGTTLWGSGCLIPGYDGKSFGSGIPPVVDGMSRGPSITMADRTTVRGFHIRNTDMGGPDQMIIIPGFPTFDISRVGIYGNNATDLTIADNLISGNETGVLLPRIGDFNLSFVNNRVHQNDLNGMWIQANGGGTGSFNADISGSTFSQNGEAGLRVASADYGWNLVRVRNSSFLNNTESGLDLTQANSDLAMALITGSQASGNGGAGIQIQQNGNVFGLANVSGSSANDNVGGGISNVQRSVDLSVGVIGMPNGLDTPANTLTTLVGFPLPEEVGLFLGPSGAVTANGNGGYGVYSEVASDDFLALGGWFDITANGNQLDGIRAMINAPEGIAVGLAGSSENLSDIFQLASQVGGLFGIHLPLSLSGGGQMQANGNAGAGFVMNTHGSNAAINAVVGLETIGNITGPGAVSFASADDLAVNAVARLNSISNTGAGLLMDVVGTDLAAIGIVADVNASGNGDSGITVSVDSPAGFAALLTLSTDALRPAAALLGDLFLGAPFPLPGTPFGPVIASGNTGDGFTANVTGHNGLFGIGALAVFLDTQANDNTGDGFDVTVGSDDGSALAAFASTDLIYDLLPDLFGGDPIPYASLGAVSASGNATNGFRIHMGAEGASTLIMAGAEANDNVAGDGIGATLASTNGVAEAFLVDIDANGHAAGRGIDLGLTSLLESRVGLIFVEADWNGRQGIRVTENSATSDAYALLAGVDADHNGRLGNQAGIVIDLTAAGDAAAALTDTYSTYNGGHGANLTLNAVGDASLFVGDFAAADLDLRHNYSADLGPLFDEIPTGPDNFSHNGGDGLRTELTSTAGDVNLGISGANADHNANRGYNLTLNALAGNALAGIEWAVANNNGGNGINLQMNGAGGGASAWLERINAWANGTPGDTANGINIVEAYTGGVFIGGQQIVSANNTANGVRIVTSGLGGMPIVDFGGPDSSGQSSIYGNGNRDFRYAYNGVGVSTALAQFNWWGAGGGTFFGNVDRSHPLAADPNAP